MPDPSSWDPTGVLDDPGFVPGAQHFSALLELLARADRIEAPRIERVLGRAGERALPLVLERMEDTRPALRARAARLLGRIASRSAAPALLRALEDVDPVVRRAAARALGKLDLEPQSRTEDLLLEALAHAELPERRAIVEALGKLGGPRAHELLSTLETPDAELERLARRSRLLLERRLGRDAPSSIELERALGERTRVLFRARTGLAELVADELEGLGRPQVLSPSTVELEFDGTLSALFVSRVALELGVPVELAPGDDLAIRVAAALASPRARRVLGAWTNGQPRFRLSFVAGGHRRALAFAIAAEVARRAPELVNDPRRPSWEVVVDDALDRLVLVPSGFADPRFAYRRRDVRAASHPTIAAALARVAGARADDIVWDPFVGSALELIERARLGPYRALHGSDVDPAALDAASENLNAAGVHAALFLGDAKNARPCEPTLIVTNPPMGRRLARDGSIGALLDDFVAHAAGVLAPGGRLVWLSPFPGRTRARARAAGLSTSEGPLVDLGGFDAELQVCRKA